MNLVLTHPTVHCRQDGIRRIVGGGPALTPVPGGIESAIPVSTNQADTCRNSPPSRPWLGPLDSPPSRPPVTASRGPPAHSRLEPGTPVARALTWSCLLPPHSPRKARWRPVRIGEKTGPDAPLVVPLPSSPSEQSPRRPLARHRENPTGPTAATGGMLPHGPERPVGSSGGAHCSLPGHWGGCCLMGQSGLSGPVDGPTALSLATGRGCYLQSPSTTRHR